MYISIIDKKSNAIKSVAIVDFIDDLITDDNSLIVEIDEIKYINYLNGMMEQPQ